MNIAIVDDEKVIREQIKNMIENKFPGYQTDTFSTGKELLAIEKDYDVIFLDIQMDGINGMDTARKLREQQKESLLIFITGMKEYVFEAFEVNAFHYLLKPVEEKKFEEVLKRAIREIEKQRKKGEKHLFIKTRVKSITLNQSSILYIENRAKKVEIHTTEEVVEMYASMRDLEKQLSDSFYRCHRGYLVNMAYITEYSNDNITLSNGEDIFLSKEKYKEFVKVYMRYLRNGGTACV